MILEKEWKSGHQGFQEYSLRVSFMFINVEGILQKLQKWQMNIEGIFLKYSVLYGYIRDFPLKGNVANMSKLHRGNIALTISAKWQLLRCGK